MTFDSPARSRTAQPGVLTTYLCSTSDERGWALTSARWTLEDMATVGAWSGRETRALREALRLSVRNFAAHLGVNDRTVTKWEAGSTTVRPRPELQAALDTVLERASDEVVIRFEAALRSTSASTDSQKLARDHDTVSLDLRDAISVAAAESTKFLMWAEMENVGDLTLEQLQSEVRRVVRAYSKETGWAAVPARS